jgi:hypothetical protein
MIKMNNNNKNKKYDTAEEWQMVEGDNINAPV